MSESTNYLISGSSLRSSDLPVSIKPLPSHTSRLLILLTRLFWVEPFWILVLCFPILFPGQFLPAGGTPVGIWPLMIGALFIFWPLRLFTQHCLLPHTPLNPYWWALLLWLPTGVWVSIDGARSWPAAGYLTLGIALYVALVNWPPLHRRPWLIVGMLTAFGLLLAVAGPLLLVSMSGTFLQQIGVTKGALMSAHLGNETINPNVLAGALVLPIPLGGCTRH